MKILIAEDDTTSRSILKFILERRGFDVVETENGLDALSIMSLPDAPPMAIIDWMMPEMDGIELCQKIREIKFESDPYLIMLTARCNDGDIVTGLDSGANDYMSKPYDNKELFARIAVGKRMIKLQNDLTARVKELENAVAYINMLQGQVSICSHCHKIRKDENSWEKLEKYISSHSNVELSHGICPECAKRYYGEEQ